MDHLDKNKTYTLDEFLFQVKEERAELYEGVPVFMAPASYEHEGVIANLIGEFRTVLKRNTCQVFGSNLQVVLPFTAEKKGIEDVTVLPDISIVCERSKLQNNRCYGAPDLVIEVLSPSTARNDRLLKRRYYEKAGVKEYLIVDFQNQIIEKYVLHLESFQLEEIYDQENQTYTSTIFPDITFTIEDIFFLN
ncbi:Uma2 family endonuclease [Virgibacillus natechei]|uniref:Uma2 family endonuclease n=1 Tax=Virgibacillus natechei TaxID=1216297 RepID=A0ABS4IBT4_9BACI|nr:Uma2 family endonuclease [Virgibacillus natechei]MBP1968399.1 Uma2 family endonuclease [Virgibacillus natechei]UZD13525.1 Uma2 family endonuclease [Virgibacillus natechei]